MREADGIVAVVEQERPIPERLAYDGGRNTFHQWLLEKLTARRDRGAAAIESRSDMMDAIDNALSMRVDLSAKAVQGDGTVDANEYELPETRVLVMPLMAAVLDVRETQLMSIFLGRAPSIQIEGVEAGDVAGAKLLELLQIHDEAAMNMPLVQATAISCAERYGFAPMRDMWRRDLGWTMQAPDVSGMSPLRRAMRKLLHPEQFQPSLGWGIKSEYGAIVPVNPRRFRQDPTVPLGETQRAEYVGECDQVGQMYLKDNDSALGGPYFNVADAIRTGGNRNIRGRSGAVNAGNAPSTSIIDELDKGPFQLERLVVRLIPREWKLSDETRPQRWVFEWIDDLVIIRAHPLANLHQECDYSCAQTHWAPFDDYCPGTAEQVEGFQRFATFSVNAHIKAVRKLGLGSMIYSEQLINQHDMEFPNWAGHIRLTEEGTNALLAGRLDIRSLVHQINVTDATGPHLKLVSFFMDLAQRLSAASDPISGIPLDSDRTATEIQGILTQSSARVTRAAQLYDATFMKQTARRLIANRQQLTETREWYRAAGEDMARELVGRLGGNDARVRRGPEGSLHALVGRDDITGRYDYVPHTGLMPVDPIRSANTYLNIIGMLAKVPPDRLLRDDGREPDLAELANEAMRKLGVKNIEQYYRLSRQAQAAAAAAPPMPGPGVRVLDNEAMQRGIEAGNLVRPEELAGLSARAIGRGGM